MVELDVGMERPEKRPPLSEQHRYTGYHHFSDETGPQERTYGRTSIDVGTLPASATGLGAGIFDTPRQRHSLQQIFGQIGGRQA